MHRRRNRGVALVAVLALLAAACSGDDGDDGSNGGSTLVIGGQEVALVPATVPTPHDVTVEAELLASVEQAVESGGDYSRDHLGDADPASLAFYDYLWRNWGIDGLADARATAVDMPRPDEGEQKLFLRLVHPDDPRPEVAVGDPVPPMFWSLHCDQEPLPVEFVDLVAEQVREASAYSLSHAAYAIVWAGEVGCQAPDLTELATATINASLRELSGATVVDHDSLLLSVGLNYLGRADLVPNGWWQKVVDAQRPDGGWAETADAGESSWHTTGVALWTLVGALGPGKGEPLVVVG